MASLSRGCNTLRTKPQAIRQSSSHLISSAEARKLQKKKKTKTKIHWRLLIKQKYAQDLFISYSSSSFFF